MYQVIIDFYNHASHDYDFCTFKTYCEVTSKLKHEINSIFNFVYIRRVLKDMTGSFKIITSTSYTFSHFRKVDNSTEQYLCQLWSKKNV